MVRFQACVVILAAGAAACGGGGKSKEGAGGGTVPDPAAPTGPGAAGLPACQALVKTLDAAVACAPSPEEQEAARLTMAMIREQVSSAEPIDPASLRIRVDMCLDFLDTLGGSLRWQKCAYTPAAHEAVWVKRLRDRRTPVPAGVDGDAKKALEFARTMRDKACACKDETCADEAMRMGFDTGDVPSLPADAPDALRDAGGLMIEEASRCQRVLRDAAAFARPVPPSDPEGAKLMIQRMKAADRMPPPAFDDGEAPEGEGEGEGEEEEGKGP